MGEVEKEKKVRHIRNYAKVKRMVNDHYDKDIAEFKELISREEEELARIEAGGEPTSDRDRPGGKYEYEKLEDYVARTRSAIARYTDYIRPARVLRNGTARPFKDTVEYWRKRDLDRLDAADRAGVVTEITCKVNWKRSRTWGMCPTCETWVSYDGEPQDFVEDGKPHRFSDGQPMKISTHYNPRTYASGCGYDKLSTVVSAGIQCPAVDRLVIEHEKCWGCYAVEGKNELPRLSFGGKGTETLRSLFKKYGKERAPIPGFEWEWREDKTWDYIHVWRSPNGRRKS